MIPRDPREVSREELGRRLCELLAAVDAERDAQKAAAKLSREKVAELLASARGLRDYLSGKRGAQVPLALVPPEGDRE